MEFLILSLNTRPTGPFPSSFSFYPKNIPATSQVSYKASYSHPYPFSIYLSLEIICVSLLLPHKLSSVSSKPYFSVENLFLIIKIFFQDCSFFIITNIVPPEITIFPHLSPLVGYLPGCVASWVKKKELSLSRATTMVSM